MSKTREQYYYSACCGREKTGGLSLLRTNNRVSKRERLKCVCVPDDGRKADTCDTERFVCHKSALCSLLKISHQRAACLSSSSFADGRRRRRRKRRRKRRTKKRATKESGGGVVQKPEWRAGDKGGKRRLRGERERLSCNATFVN